MLVMELPTLQKSLRIARLCIPAKQRPRGGTRTIGNGIGAVKTVPDQLDHRPSERIASRGRKLACSIFIASTRARRGNPIAASGANVRKPE
jgi:hypothetical protein